MPLIEFKYPKIYCITFRNPERKARMTERFKILDLDAEFVEALPWDDPAIRPPDNVLEFAKSSTHWNSYAWSTAHAHAAAIQRFIDSGEPAAVICEDDVHIHRAFKVEMPCLLANMYKMDLEVLLLGYLTTNPPAMVNGSWHPLAQHFMYFPCAFDLWGAQMYLITREYALNAIAKYGPNTGYPIRSLLDPELTVFVADWIWNKASEKRGILSPMIAVEEGKIQSDENRYGGFHQLCFNVNYHHLGYV